MKRIVLKLYTINIATDNLFSVKYNELGMWPGFFFLLFFVYMHSIYLFKKKNLKKYIVYSEINLFNHCKNEYLLFIDKN